MKRRSVNMLRCQVSKVSLYEVWINFLSSHLELTNIVHACLTARCLPLVVIEVFFKKNSTFRSQCPLLLWGGCLLKKLKDSLTPPEVGWVKCSVRFSHKHVQYTRPSIVLMGKKIQCAVYNSALWNVTCRCQTKHAVSLISSYKFNSLSLTLLALSCAGDLYIVSRRMTAGIGSSFQITLKSQRADCRWTGGVQNLNTDFNAWIVLWHVGRDVSTTVGHCLIWKNRGDVTVCVRFWIIVAESQAWLQDFHKV